MVPFLARSAMASEILGGGGFIETHPDTHYALSDGPSFRFLGKLYDLLITLEEIVYVDKSKFLIENL